MAEIAFTQYLRPSGTPHPVTIDRPPEIAGLAAILREAGCAFEIEVLRDGTISMSIERDEFGETDVLAHSLCPNGPEVLEAVDRTITVAFANLITAKQVHQ